MPRERQTSPTPGGPRVLAAARRTRASSTGGGRRCRGSGSTWSPCRLQGGDRDLLWQRFCSVVGLTGRFVPDPSRSNQSLGVQAARLMQRVNVAAQSRGVAKDVYMRHFKHALGKGLLAEAQRPAASDRGIG